jgi:hypothetical protein
MEIEVSKWKKLGQTSNADFYEIAPDFLAVVPFEGCTDDEETARASVAMQLAYLRPRNQRAAIIIFLDPIAEQTAGARAVYRDLPNPALQACFALVGGTLFGRAVGSLFLGLSRPKVPTQMFATLEQALAWGRGQLDRLE